MMPNDLDLIDDDGQLIYVIKYIASCNLSNQGDNVLKNQLYILMLLIYCLIVHRYHFLMQKLCVMILHHPSIAQIDHLNFEKEEKKNKVSRY